MKRLHLHIRVYDIESNIKFYSSLFALAPVARGPDCAQWILDTPQMTFTISERGSTMGLEHLGFQVDSETAMTWPDWARRLKMVCIMTDDGPPLDG